MARNHAIILVSSEFLIRKRNSSFQPFLSISSRLFWKIPYHILRWKFGNHKPLIVIWYAFNIAATVFFGLVHQGGVTPAVKYIARDLQLKQNTIEANVIWSHTYMPPTFELLRISERSRRLKENANKTPDMFPSYFLRWVLLIKVSWSIPLL